MMEFSFFDACLICEMNGDVFIRISKGPVKTIERQQMTYTYGCVIKNNGVLQEGITRCDLIYKWRKASFRKIQIDDQEIEISETCYREIKNKIKETASCTCE